MVLSAYGWERLSCPAQGINAGARMSALRQWCVYRLLHVHAPAL